MACSKKICDDITLCKYAIERELSKNEGINDVCVNQVDEACKCNDNKSWEMAFHCEKVIFPRPIYHFWLPSEAAQYYFHLYSSKGKHRQKYQEDINNAFTRTLCKASYNGLPTKNLIISDLLIRLGTFDYVGRKIAINRLEKYIKTQTVLESFCMEGLSLTREEGVRLVLALYNSRKTVKYLYCWRAFKRRGGPLAMNIDRSIGLRSRTEKYIGKCDWFRGIASLESLTTLAVNYAYIATPTGDLLICLCKKFCCQWQWLQLLCTDDEIPGIDFSAGFVSYAIPDTAWEQARTFAPNLKVKYFIAGIPEHDKHRRFFTKNVPVHSFMFSSDIDLKFQQPWYFDSTIKTLCLWYSNTLVHLYLQLWHHRELLDARLRTLFLYLPALQSFEFIGEIRKISTLCAMCCQIRLRKCGVKTVNVKLQNIIHAETDKENWIKGIQYLLLCFKKDFKELNVTFNVNYYNN